MTLSNAALEARLATLAAAGDTITCGMLARDLGLRIRDLTADLETLMEDGAAALRPLRAALCWGRLSDGQPACGFFDTAVALGSMGLDAPEAFVASQRARLFSAAANRA